MDIRVNPLTFEPIKKLKPRAFGTPEFPLRQSDLSKLCGSFACSRAFFLYIKEYNEKLRLQQWRHPKTVRGTVIHKTIEEIAVNNAFAKASWIYFHNWRATENDAAEPPILWRDSDKKKIITEGFEMLRGYLKSKEYAPDKVVGREICFSVTIADKYCCVGTIDEIRLNHGQYELLDYKTGEIPSQEELTWSYQLGLYALAMLRGWIWNKDAPHSREQLGVFPARMGLIKLTDYIPYERPTAKLISYNSETKYYGVNCGTRITPKNSRDGNGNNLLAQGLQRGPGIYWSNFDLDFLPQLEKSIANAISLVRLNRYSYANSSMACGKCPYKGAVCRDLVNECGSELTNLSVLNKPVKRRINDGSNQQCVKSIGLSGGAKIEPLRPFEF